MGFKSSESRTLQNIATKVAPKKPDMLLTTPTGRENLRIDLKKRITKRQRELEVLQGILAKLDRMLDQNLHDRGAVRVEAGIQIWVAKKVEASEQPRADDVFTDVDSVAGMLLDLSEGGAAIRVELPTLEGDLIEFWSGDQHINISSVTAGVVDVQESGAGMAPICHVQFISPNLAELREAILAFQDRNG